MTLHLHLLDTALTEDGYWYDVVPLMSITVHISWIPPFGKCSIFIKESDVVRFTMSTAYIASDRVAPVVVIIQSVNIFGTIRQQCFDFGFKIH
jgi:hypothetical protein